MSEPKEPPCAVICPTCEGTGDIPPDDPDAKKRASGLDIRNPEIARLRTQLKTAELGRDMWRKVGTALMNAAFGYTMGGFGEIPPTEIVDELVDDPKVIDVLRDALLGRAWRVRGSQGDGTCDYPLCPNRKRPRARLTEVVIGTATAGYAKIHICTPFPDDQECHRWAMWVQARAALGRIEVKP